MSEKLVMSDHVVIMCACCDVRPATCVGLYESSHCQHAPECEPLLELCSDTVDQPACDECCGHGNEDGHCHPIEPATIACVSEPTRGKKCKRHEHDYKLIKGGKRQVCTRCGDAFPCRHACDHLDCRDARIDAEIRPNWFEAF